MTEQAAPAKVNLFLHILGRRDDGYHLLDSLVAVAAFGDRLEAFDADDVSLSITGPFAAGLADEPDNLVLRAAHLLASSAGIVPKARLVLHKNLPIASGIGGGSADAAATLRLLSQLWGLQPDPALLHRIAQRLGADVPVCLASHTARMTGIGEQLEAAPPLPSCGLVLVNPGLPVSTQAVFRSRDPGFSAPARLADNWPDAYALAADLADTHNDLQVAAIRLCPTIDQVLAAIASDRDCLLARMSGSGATCFGLFPDAGSAERAAKAIGRNGWWAWGGAVGQGFGFPPHKQPPSGVTQTGDTP